MDSTLRHRAFPWKVLVIPGPRVSGEPEALSTGGWQEERRTGTLLAAVFMDSGLGPVGPPRNDAVVQEAISNPLPYVQAATLYVKVRPSGLSRKAAAINSRV
ncbi:hypothetical protein CHELA20_52002 [Hyphomicrobiales bacterium]|nr:hypothetical protein CHELA41_22924 [Hyphomicrobiales bacterium]CAH1680004.1 hypothetical protein CHELA20_52002 [Hyphomicrobiales bacterium]